MQTGALAFMECVRCTIYHCSYDRTQYTSYTELSDIWEHFHLQRRCALWLLFYLRLGHILTYKLTVMAWRGVSCRVGVVRPSKQREHQGRQPLHQRSARLFDAARTRADLLVVRKDHQRAHHLRQPDWWVELICSLDTGCWGPHAMQPSPTTFKPDSTHKKIVWIVSMKSHRLLN